MIEINRDPSRRQLRWFAGLLFPLFCAWIAFLLDTRAGLRSAAIALVAFGLTAGLVGLASRRAARWLWIGTMYAVYPIGWVVSQILLALVYYLVFAGVGLVLRLLGKDPMTRRFEPETSSYWIPRPESSDTERYFRQY